MQTLTDDGFRAELQEASGVAPAFAIESFSDLDGDVRQSLRRLRRSPFLLHRDRVRGFVYDVDSTGCARSTSTRRTDTRVRRERSGGGRAVVHMLDVRTHPGPTAAGRAG